MGWPNYSFCVLIECLLDVGSLGGRIRNAIDFDAYFGSWEHECFKGFIIKKSDIFFHNILTYDMILPKLGHALHRKLFLSFNKQAEWWRIFMHALDLLSLEKG